MIDATTHYVFGIDLLEAEDATRFDPDDVLPVVHRRDYDKLRDLTAKLASSTQRLMELEERRAALRVEIVSTANAMINGGLRARNNQRITDALRLLNGLKDTEKNHVG